MMSELPGGALAPIWRKLAAFVISHKEPGPVTTTVLLLSPTPLPAARRPVALMTTPPAEIVTLLLALASPTNSSLTVVNFDPAPVTVSVLLLLPVPLRLSHIVPLFEMWAPLLTTRLAVPFQPMYKSLRVVVHTVFEPLRLMFIVPAVTVASSIVAAFTKLLPCIFQVAMSDAADPRPTSPPLFVMELPAVVSVPAPKVNVEPLTTTKSLAISVG